MKSSNQTTMHPEAEKLDEAPPSVKYVGTILFVLLLAIVTLSCAYPLVERLFATREKSILPGLSQVSVPASGDSFQHCALGTINKHIVTGGNKIIIDSGKEPQFAFEGWAVNPADDSPEGGVFGIIDNKSILPTTYGLARSDVSKYLQKPNSVNCGYFATSPSNKFDKGEHTFSLAIVEPDKVHYYRLDNLVHFEIQ